MIVQKKVIDYRFFAELDRIYRRNMLLPADRAYGNCRNRRMGNLFILIVQVIIASASCIPRLTLISDVKAHPEMENNLPNQLIVCLFGNPAHDFINDLLWNIGDIRSFFQKITELLETRSNTG